jgi:hypothetical protein
MVYDNKRVSIGMQWLIAGRKQNNWARMVIEFNKKCHMVAERIFLSVTTGLAAMAGRCAPSE